MTPAWVIVTPTISYIEALNHEKEEEAKKINECHLGQHKYVAINKEQIKDI